MSTDPNPLASGAGLRGVEPVPSTRSSPRKVGALMAEEACAPTSRMRSLAKCFEELSSANAPQTKVHSMQTDP